MNLSAYTDSDIEIKAEADKRINEEHARLPYVEMIDPFLNMFGAAQNDSNRIYNTQLKNYFAKKETQIRDEVTQEIEEKFMMPICLSFCNDGHAPSGKCDISIKLSDVSHVYLDSALNDISGIAIEKPMQMPNGVIPCLSPRPIPYTCKKWDFQDKTTDCIELKTEVLNQHRKDDDLLPTLYVDTRYAQKIVIDWTIIEPSFIEPITGELIVNVG